MEKTVGMITIYRKNYGAFLQAYALQQTLISLGFKPEIIRYDYYRDHTVLGIGLDKIKQPLTFCKMLAVEILRHKAHRCREKVFEASIEKQILESAGYYKTYDALENNPPKYDFYITGSDQVFNPEISHHALKARLLCFVKEGKKVSYAASAGNSKIPEAYKKEFMSALNTFSAISTRESGLRDYIEKEYGLKAFENADPTLLLSRGDWLRFAKYDDKVTEDYIFYYRVQRQDMLLEKAKCISEQLDLPIYVADGNDTFPNQIPREGDLSPEKWVGMMERSTYVVTNSFHGTAFALNLEKRATIVVPPVWGDRIKNLLVNCGLEIEDSRDIMQDDISDVYAGAREYFQQERRKTRELFCEIASK